MKRRLPRRWETGLNRCCGCGGSGARCGDAGRGLSGWGVGLLFRWDVWFPLPTYRVVCSEDGDGHLLPAVLGRGGGWIVTKMEMGEGSLKGERAEEPPTGRMLTRITIHPLLTMRRGCY